MKKMRCSVRGKFCRQRINPPGKFAKGSFRTISVSRSGLKAVVACPRSSWSGRRCRTSMHVQSLLAPKALLRRTKGRAYSLTHWKSRRF